MLLTGTRVERGSLLEPAVSLAGGKATLPKKQIRIRRYGKQILFIWAKRITLFGAFESMPFYRIPRGENRRVPSGIEGGSRWKGALGTPPGASS
ncbi:uncharacterized protein VTP21DRAFT_1142 [Calcarisporiella thermophila]|uniref:uncharacterized protein n=1 Tax=Calcarisporiella thermophila TaxID=911321 RepID=UPI0037438061